MEEHRPTRRRLTGTALRLMLAVVLVLAVAIPVTAQVTDEDIAEAEAELAALQEELQVLSDEWEAAVARRVTIEQAVEDQSQRLLETTLLVEELELMAQDRAAEMYMDASLTGISSFLAPDTVDGAGAGIGYLDEVADADRQLITELEAQKADLKRQQEELGVAQAELDDAADALDANVDQIIVKLDEAQQRYDYLVEKQAEEEAARRAAEEAARRAAEEAARQATSTTSTTQAATGGGDTTTTTSTAPPATTTTTAPPPSTGGRVCPVAGATTFSDSWGAPRSGGRTHKGVDMLAARGTPIVAIEDGRVSRLSNSSLGGLSIYFTGNSGDYYYYAHLDGFADGIGSGSVVSAGTVLGYNGSTGNAPSHIPHLHFQWAPNSGSWVNPYPLVEPLC